MTDTPTPRRRILLVAESVTLAHFARCATIAGMLDPHRYDVVLASDPRYLHLEPEPHPFTFRAIRSVPSAQFNEALAKGRAVYDADTLKAYVEDDLALLDSVRPDLVIGDFRLSMAVSAPVSGIPYASLINAYWSPFSRLRYPVPDLPFVRALGVRIGQRLFDMVRPAAFALHAVPLNRVRRHYGLASLGHDLRQVYSWADHVLYPDMDGLLDMAPLPANHHFVGPILWSAQTAVPDWWQALPDDRPVIYVTLGSSGDAKLLPMMLEALSDLPVTVVATTGNATIPRPPQNACLAPYLPGDRATARAALVICNGGNLTTYQAMSCGVPVIGIANNMDQLLNMQMVERLGAGRLLRAMRCTGPALRETVMQMLGDPKVAEQAQRVGKRLAAVDTGGKIDQVLDGILG